jgi:DNA-binding MurR/RpiR family transcriptional regulator
MINELLKKEKKIAVIGLGYVGLPIALEFARKFSVIGFDINAKRVEMLRNRIDPSSELAPKNLMVLISFLLIHLTNLLRHNFILWQFPLLLTNIIHLI